jgi:hypothetical protein
MSRPDDELIEIVVTLVRETDTQIVVDDGDREVWLPKSKVTWENSASGKSCVVRLAEWLAMNEGLI